MLIHIKLTLKRQKLLSIMQELEAISEPALTLYLPAESSEADLNQAQKNIPYSDRIPEAAEKMALESTTGAVFFWGLSYKFLFLPNIPVTEKITLHGYNTERLRAALSRDYQVALILIRLGVYGIGLFQGANLVASKVGSGLIHSRHKKGGSSQRRFERHRDKQIEFFFGNICDRARQKLEPYMKTIDYIYYGGEKGTINSFLAQCDYLHLLKDKVAPVLLNVREPKQDSLIKCIEKIYSSTVVQWLEEKVGC